MPAGGVSVWLAALVGALVGAVSRIVSFIPELLGALLILLIGWGIAKLVQVLVVKGLRAVHFNRLMDREGVNSALERADIRTSATEILGIIAYWFVFLFAIQAAVSVLGIPALTALMAAVILYLPRIFAALLVIVIGAVIANFLARLTRSSASAANIGYSGILGSIVLASVLFFTFTIALNILGLEFAFLLPAFVILLGAVALAGAIAFGIGGREYASDLIAGRELRTLFSTGDTLMSDEVTGTIAEMKPTFTVIRTDRGDVAMQNSELMHKHVRRKSTPMEGGGGMRAA
jgi:hypothetical protein